MIWYFFIDVSNSFFFFYHSKGDICRDVLDIEGWDAVDALCQCLLHLKGTVSPEEAQEIAKCYKELPEYDKKPLKYSLTVPKQLDVTFARSKDKTTLALTL